MALFIWWIEDGIFLESMGYERNFLSFFLNEDLWFPVDLLIGPLSIFVPLGIFFLNRGGSPYLFLVYGILDGEMS